MMWGFNCSSDCLFCHGHMENKEHMFFRCSFNLACSHARFLGCQSVKWFQAEVSGKSLFSSVICKLCFGATVYHFWRLRNDLLHGNIPRSEEGIIAQIKWQVRTRLLAKGKVKIVGSIIGIVHSWNLQNLI
jgi:hypothetical protein